VPYDQPYGRMIEAYATLNTQLYIQGGKLSITHYIITLQLRYAHHLVIAPCLCVVCFLHRHDVYCQRWQCWNQLADPSTLRSQF
jgi:hypothetical protein